MSFDVTKISMLLLVSQLCLSMSQGDFNSDSLNM